MTENQDLERKLAEVAKWKRGEWLSETTGTPISVYGSHMGYYWEQPNRGGKKIEESDLPFTKSLDACFKWLVPKALARICQLFKVDIKSANKILFQRWLDERFRINNIGMDALALCLVIEKLVDANAE